MVSSPLESSCNSNSSKFQELQLRFPETNPVSYIGLYCSNLRINRGQLGVIIALWLWWFYDCVYTIIYNDYVYIYIYSYIPGASFEQNKCSTWRLFVSENSAATMRQETKRTLSVSALMCGFVRSCAVLCARLRDCALGVRPWIIFARCTKTVRLRKSARLPKKCSTKSRLSAYFCSNEDPDYISMS